MTHVQIYRVHLTVICAWNHVMFCAALRSVSQRRAARYRLTDRRQGRDRDVSRIHDSPSVSRTSVTSAGLRGFSKIF